MSMLKIEKYTKNIEENNPDHKWEQTDNNATSIATILITIDNLQSGQSIVITKI